MAGDVLKELGKRMRARRKELGFLHEPFALAAEIDRSDVGRLERGERNVPFTVLCRLCAALAWDVAALTTDLPR